jgi:hypothetical protein
LHIHFAKMPHINTTTRILAAATLLFVAALLSVPLGLLLAAVCFGLRRREPWMIDASHASTPQV